MNKAQKRTDLAGNGTPAEQASTSEASGVHDASSKKPIWSKQINRVSGSIWKHDHEGEPRYTVSITRSYLNKRTNEWKRDSYFDRRDLDDVRLVASEAENFILDLEEGQSADSEA